jgi:hypothetical protein
MEEPDAPTTTVSASTATATQLPMATATPRSPPTSTPTSAATLTPTSITCIGDGNGYNMVAINELRSVNHSILSGLSAEAYNDGMRIFLAGASGVIGQRLIPRLVQAGHVVGGLTRSPSKTELLSHLGAEPILCDVFDREALIQAVRDFKPDVVLNELTDLPDDAAQISELADLNARIRTEGTRNLIEAARRSGSPKILAQSVAWQLPDGPDAQAVAELERSVLAEGGVVLRYGQFYGPGTYNEQQPPEEPRVHIDRAAERTVEALGEPTGVVVIID